MLEFRPGWKWVLTCWHYILTLVAHLSNEVRREKNNDWRSGQSFVSHYVYEMLWKQFESYREKKPKLIPSQCDHCRIVIVQMIDALEILVDTTFDERIIHESRLTIAYLDRLLCEIPPPVDPAVEAPTGALFFTFLYF